MSKSSWGVCSIILCAVFAVALTVPAHVGSEVFVVSSSINGDANYMFMTENGKFDRPEILQQTGNTTINLPFKFSYGNGLGDFNNDGLLDYILAMGWSSGDIYISEKLDVGNQFGEPIFAGNWGLEEEGGFFPMDLAVADYNEDGNADFVLSLDSSSHSGLYLGDGAFGFSSELLPASAPYLSAGADAADFNNDGHADFVIAPRSDEPFFVSLGDGTGKFTTTSFASYDGGAVWGVAAADFTGNGNADIVAAYYDFLYVYEGAGDGVNFTYLASYELPFNQSAIDNHDFNDDGLQDLVVASYDMATGVWPYSWAKLVGHFCMTRHMKAEPVWHSMACRPSPGNRSKIWNPLRSSNRKIWNSKSVRKSCSTVRVPMMKTVKSTVMNGILGMRHRHPARMTRHPYRSVRRMPAPKALESIRHISTRQAVLIWSPCWLSMTKVRPQASRPRSWCILKLNRLHSRSKSNFTGISIFVPGQSTRAIEPSISEPGSSSPRDMTLTT